MRRLLELAFIVTLLSLPVAGVTQDIDLARIEPVLEAAEELSRSSRIDILTVEDVRAVLDKSCTVLKYLSQDIDFENLLKVYEKRQYDETLASDVRSIFLNFRKFVVFLEDERNIMLAAGSMSEATVSEILDLIRKVRLEAAAYKLDAEALLTDVRRLEEQVCSASEHVLADAQHAKILCYIKSITPFVFGAVTTLVDGVAYLWSPLKIPEAARGASIAAGNVIMGAAAFAAGLMPQC